MPRFSYFDLEQASPEIKAVIGKSRPLNIYRALSHAPTVAPGFFAMGGALLRDSLLDPKLRELVILRVGRICKSSYELYQHERIARRVGLPDDKIKATEQGPEAPVFDELERLVLHFTDEVVHKVKAPDALFAAVLGRLGEARMVELLLTIGFYMLVSRFLENCEVEIEPATA